MTTLVAIQGDGWAVVGCDSRSSDDSGRPMDLATHKIINNNGILIAGSGASRGSNLLQFGWKAPKPTASENLDKFMTQKFIPGMRKLFVDAGYDMKEDGDVAEHDSSFIIVVRGVIYPVFEDYSWDRDNRGIYYSGSGGDIALGALEALCVDDPELTPDYAEFLVKQAILIAAKWDIHTSDPVIVETQYA
jgi:ATP-dependent protease HslVU (ClpYQ) peptidase subunit